MSLARKHRERALGKSLMAADPADNGGVPAAARDEAVTGAAQIILRLRHDRRELSETKSRERKIEKKRAMIPAYLPWIDGVLETATPPATGAGEQVIPTIMVWAIDTEDFALALRLAEFVLRHRIALPERFNRDAASLIVEETSEIALRHLLDGRAFPLGVLAMINELTIADDMHDEIRAKLYKAIGLELAREADEAGAAPSAEHDRALAALRRAQELYDRIGVKDRIRRIERANDKATEAEAKAEVKAPAKANAAAESGSGADAEAKAAAATRPAKSNNAGKSG